MTKTQIKKAMAAASIEGEISGTGTAWSVELADEATMEKFCKEVCQAGGFQTGYGSWILRANYQDNGDFNDKSSRWHY